MFDVRFNDNEVKQITDKIQSLQARFAKNALRRATRRGARVIQDAARQNARMLDDPTTPENIAKNIVIRTGRTRKKDQVKLRVGVLGGARKDDSFTGEGKKNAGGDTWYWRFLEFGTSKVPARPFLRPAMMEQKELAYNEIFKAMLAELTKEIERRN